MDKDISILLLEDNESDAELIRQTVLAAGINALFEHVDSGSKFEASLQTCQPDLIISDFSIPHYNGKSALAAAQRLRPGTPFIFFSGTIGEERAIEALKLGATDYVLKDKPKRLISAIERAISDAERKRSQREAEAKIKAQALLLDLATDAIIVRDLENRIQFWNRGAERLYGFRREEIIGRKLNELIATNSGRTFAEGTRITLDQGQWEGEVEHLSKDGKVLVVLSRWTLVRNGQGEPEGILAINSDITEKRSLEKQFLRAQRLESIGTLASGIADDLNNILAPVLLACEMLRDVQPDEQAKKLMDVAVQSAKRGTCVVKQLLTFVKGGDGKLITVNTSALPTEICTALTTSIPKNIRTYCDIEPTLWNIKADPTQLHQVLMNLCINARDAMPKGGAITITAKNNSDSSILIAVKDTGTGIPSELLDKIFDPFFTTKEPGKGTGLGLSTVVGIVKSHGGTLKVDSQEGIGTTFELCFPSTSVQAETTKDV
jgi:PAS domain S-box-containing protein